MAKLTIRDLPDEVHRALLLRATQQGRSLEAEVCRILVDATHPTGRRGLRSLLVEASRAAPLSDDEVAALEMVQDRRPASSVFSCRPVPKP